MIQWREQGRRSLVGWEERSRDWSASGVGTGGCTDGCKEGVIRHGGGGQAGEQEVGRLDVAC
jgi:hypothetical protein